MSFLPQDDVIFDADDEDNDHTKDEIIYDDSTSLNSVFTKVEHDKNVAAVKANISDYETIINRAILLSSTNTKDVDTVTDSKNSNNNNDNNNNNSNDNNNNNNNNSELQGLHSAISLLPHIHAQEDTKQVNTNDLSLEPNIDDYNTINVQNFGFSLLLGQGYVPGEGIGKTNKSEVKQVELPSTKLLGYGSWGLGSDKESIMKKQALKQLEQTEEWNKNQAKNDQNEKNTAVATVTKDEIRIEKSDKKSLDLQPSSFLQQSCDNNRSRDRDYISSKSSSNSQKQVNNMTLDPSYRRDFGDQQYKWLHPRLHVKIIDKNHKYYKYKAEVIRISQYKSHDIILKLDVDEPKTNNHEVRVPWTYLETVIPVDLNKRIIIVNGKYQGYVGVIISKQGNYADISLHIAKNTYIEIKNISFDDFCEFL